MADELLEPKRVHAEYGFTAQTLANWRWMGIGPDYIKTSPGRSGRIRYRRSVIEAWLNAQTVNTADGAA
ncbi:MULTISPECIES: AlpA family transcriptional regulator [unclassified Streptomyces]|uniref:helix-turn-helix transcriptional regulator n=1 Tax=unclassified Streptomyces TaxID=2593676 RepID=UPI001371CDDD|nr:DNA-binding protein [Streptomyces sp. SID8374]MYX15430.1 DNA-binding protein [Streptomyces sp. SID8374]